MAPEVKSLRGKLIEHLGSMMVATADASGSTSGQMVPSSARRVADDAMSIVRAHDEEHAKAARPAVGITREQLATALAKTRIIIEEPEVSNSVHGGPDGWQPLWAKGAPKEPGELAEAVIMLLEIGQRDVVDAHICCEHVGIDDAELIGDPELAAMAALLPGLPMVSKLGHDARERVMDWARRRATDGQAPF